MDKKYVVSVEELKDFYSIGHFKGREDQKRGQVDFFDKELNDFLKDKQPITEDNIVEVLEKHIEEDFDNYYEVLGQIAQEILVSK